MTTPDDPVLARIVDRVRAAAADRTALRLRGGGSKDFYGGAPRGELLDLRPLAGISSYEPSELVVTARAGTPLADLEAVLAERGQCLPFEPPHFGERATATGTNAGGTSSAGTGSHGMNAADESACCGSAAGTSAATVGGMVAAGLAGPSRSVVGGVRDHVLGATLLNGRAEVLSFGGQVMKNVAGYDVSRLLAGSMGELGVICEVSLKVLPYPMARRTLRFELGQAGAIRQCNLWAGKPLPLSASAWVGGALFLRLAGAVASVDAAARQLGGQFGGTVIEAAEAEAFWSAVRDQHHPFFRQAGSAGTLWRLSLPQTASATALGPHAEAGFVEWGGAQRWLWSDAPGSELQRAAVAAGGHATRWRSPPRGAGAPGADSGAGAFTPVADPLARIHQALKAAFDPAGIFNPGRLIDTPCKPS